MKYFDALRIRFSAFPSIKVEGLSDQELQFLLSFYRASDFPDAVKEYLRFCGKSLSHWGGGALGGYNDFATFKLAMIYESIEYNMPIPKKTDFVFFNNQDYAFAYVDLTSADDDPYVNLLVTPEEEHGKLKFNICKFSEFVIKDIYESPPVYLHL